MRYSAALRLKKLLEFFRFPSVFGFGNHLSYENFTFKKISFLHFLNYTSKQNGLLAENHWNYFVLYEISLCIATMSLGLLPGVWPWPWGKGIKDNSRLTIFINFLSGQLVKIVDIISTCNFTARTLKVCKKQRQRLYKHQLNLGKWQEEFKVNIQTRWIICRVINKNSYWRSVCKIRRSIDPGYHDYIS